MLTDFTDYTDFCFLGWGWDCSFFFSFGSMISDSTFIPRISSNFGVNIFMNGSICFSILKVTLSPSISKSNCFRKRNSWRALIFCFWSVMILFILYV